MYGISLIVTNKCMRVDDSYAIPGHMFTLLMYRALSLPVLYRCTDFDFKNTIIAVFILIFKSQSQIAIAKNEFVNKTLSSP